MTRVEAVDIPAHAFSMRMVYAMLLTCPFRPAGGQPILGHFHLLRA
jgi:hypothetical protein